MLFEQCKYYSFAALFVGWTGLIWHVSANYHATTEAKAEIKAVIKEAEQKQVVQDKADASGDKTETTLTAVHTKQQIITKEVVREVTKPAYSVPTPDDGVRLIEQALDASREATGK